MATTTPAPTTLADRALLRLSEGDVRGFLQGLVTNDVAGPLPVWAGLLTPQGKCLFDFLVWADGDDLLLDCEASAADDLQKRLILYRLRRPIGITLEEALAVHWSPGGDHGVSDPRLPELGRRWLAPSAPAQAGAQSSFAPTQEATRLLPSQEHSSLAPSAPAQAGAQFSLPPPEEGTGLLPSLERSWLEHRLRLGVCEGRAELGDLLWLECNAAELHGVSFTKGCYVGQENTARMNWRSKVNRRLVVVPATEPGPRTKAFYPDLGLAVEHRRADDLLPALIPAWLAPALAAPADG